MRLTSLTAALLLALAACKPEPADPDPTSTDGVTSTGPATTGTSDDPTTDGPEPETGSTGTSTTGDTTGDTELTTTGGFPDSETVVLDAQGCMSLCVLDVDPSTPVLEPNCAVFEIDPVAETREEIAKCEQVGDEWLPPAGQSACFAELVDPSANTTPSPLDDMSQECVDTGANVQFQIVRTEPPLPGIVLEATCEPSKNPKKDCPNL